MSLLAAEPLLVTGPCLMRSSSMPTSCSAGSGTHTPLTWPSSRPAWCVSSRRGKCPSAACCCVCWHGLLGWSLFWEVDQVVGSNCSSIMRLWHSRGMNLLLLTPRSHFVSNVLSSIFYRPSPRLVWHSPARSCGESLLTTASVTCTSCTSAPHPRGVSPHGRSLCTTLGALCLRQ